MNRIWIAWALAAGAAMSGAAAAQSHMSAPPQHPQEQAGHPRRVHAQLSGFELAPGKATANQIGGASRGAGQRLVLYAPNKARVFTLRPAFHWQGDATAAYTVHVQDLTGALSWDRSVTGTSLDYPADAPPLAAGQTYLWKVTPDSPLLGPPPPAAILVVVGGADRAQLEAGLGRIAGSGFDAESARAKYFFDQRLWYDAQMAYSALIAKYPEQRSLYEMRGWLYQQLPATASLADADFARAR